MATICRLCLRRQSVAHSLLEKCNFDMLKALTAIQVQPSDASTASCTACLDEVKLAFKIQQKILASNEKLKHGEAGKIALVQTELSKDSLEQCSRKCTICIAVVELNLFSNHVRSHFDRPHNCDLCEKEYDTWKKYVNHWNEVHSKVDNLTCTECNAAFRYRSIYLLHRNLVHDIEEPSGKIKPKIEFVEVEFKEQESHEIVELKKESFAEESPVKIETKTEWGEVELKNQSSLEIVEKCYDGYLNKTDGKEIIKGRRKINNAEQCFKCNFCEREFPTKKQCQTHRLDHQKKTCQICSARISCSNISKHMQTHKLDPRICEQCGVILRNSESLRGHMIYQHGNFRAECKECGNRVFKTRYSYQLHMKKHKGEKTHVCESCGKSFYTAYEMTTHKNMTHLKLRPFICTYCQKGFSSQSSLRTHIRQHTLETPYRCDVCGAGFRQNVSLKVHMRSKHNIVEAKNCECTVCGKEFASKQAVQTHMRLHQ